MTMWASLAVYNSVPYLCVLYVLRMRRRTDNENRVDYIEHLLSGVYLEGVQLLAGRGPLFHAL